jgi:TctA family transporter
MQTMISHDNDWTAFFNGPIRGTFMLLSLVALLFPVIKKNLGRRRSAGA